MTSPLPPIDQVVEDFTIQCKELGTTERAEFEQGYLKTDMSFFGCTVPQLRKLAGAFLKQEKQLGRDRLLALVEALYAPRNHNLCHIATILVAKRAELLL